MTTQEHKSERDVMRIAMWSGPRNISTALMRSWGERADTCVVDEPFYASYLARTGIDHPGREETLRAGETDYGNVVAELLGPVPVSSGGRGPCIFYQKQMAHHMLPGDDLSWTAQVTNAFLIRDPGEMITSYIKVIPNPTARQLGLPQQVELFEQVRTRTGWTPPVVDSRTILQNPRAGLSALCAALEVPFDEGMLSWAPGPRSTDGPWAPFWYESLYRSTGFEKYAPKADRVPASLHGVLKECQEIYDYLKGFAVGA